MSKIFSAIVIVSSCFLFACSNGGKADASGILPNDVLSDSSKFTTIEWLDTLVNFGTINAGESAHIKFRCKNTGDKPLYIASVHPSCGCTVADYTKSAIPPGGMGEVNAVFDSERAPSPIVRKTIEVNTNTSNPSPYLVFTGEVKNPPEGKDSTK